MLTRPFSPYRARLMSTVVLACLVQFLLLSSGCMKPSWPQWGGPDRNFVSNAKGLASSWSEAGPRRLWSRPLGEGNSAIALVEGRLFTSYRTGDDEVVIALDAGSGETIWEFAYAAPISEEMETRYGIGPAATPLVMNGRVYTFGRTGILQCLDAQRGRPIWTCDTVGEFGAKTPEFGFASSPVSFGNMLVVMVGGTGCGVMAFDLDDGAVVWKRHDFENVYASLLPIQVGGQDQLVAFTDTEVVGLAPTDGELLWRYPHVNQWKTNTTTPVWDGRDTLFVTSGGEGGARGLKLTRKGNATEVEEVWATRKIAVGGHANALAVGDRVIASTGSASLLSAVDIHTGEIAWRKRGFAAATLVFADGKLIILDENGTLALATPGVDDLTVESQVQLLEKVSWTVPTLVGKVLYLRDNSSIMALDLG